MKIQKLPIEVSSKLQSGIIVTDAVQCVLELVYNSLDAEATGIAVRIDLKTYQIRVIDNGKGIKKEDLEFVGERFMTSKYQSYVDMETSIPTYGYKGQALSSLQKLSRSLRIESKPEDEGPTYVKVFQNNKAFPITTTESEKIGRGTSIFIDDFMYTMPVRRKRINEVFDMEEIKNQLQYLAIVHFRVCFTLRNENKSVIVLQTPQASSILESLTNMYGKAFARCLKTLNYQEKKYEISGYFSLKPQNQNNVQLIYVNKRIITKGVIHKFINNLIKEYNRKEILFSDSPESKILKSLKNTCNAFIIDIKCPRTYYELFTNVRKTKVEFKNWKVLLKCIHKALRRVYKEIMNLGSSSNNQHDDDDEDKAETFKDNRVFGTSFLINAIKGAPAKRELRSKRDYEKRKKIKTNDNEDLSKSCGNKKVNLSTKNLTKECPNDSMESPIPKKSYKSNTMILSNSKKTRSYNQSFVEFYEWLKTKFETDTNAFNLYSDFLQSKNKEGSKFKSPVFGRKPKRKQTLSPQKIREKKPTKATNDLSALHAQMAITSQKQLKIFPNDHLRMKKAVQFVSETKSSIPESQNFDFINHGNVCFEKHSSHSVFRKPEGLFILDRSQRQLEYNHTQSSLASSEVQLTNIIRFRNLSESFLSKPSNTHLLSEKTISSFTSNTWASHYENFKSNNVEFHEKECNVKNYASWLELNGRNKNLELLNFYNVSKAGFFKLANELKTTEPLQDAEIQVNMSEIILPVEKVNAVVQTCQEVPESQSFENSYMFSQANDMHCNQIGSSENQNHNNWEERISQEPLNPEFWNTFSHTSLNKTNITEFCSNIDKINEKNSASCEFICGQKSNSSWNNQNEKTTSKETQTLAAIWTGSLTKIFSANCDAALNSKLTDSKSEITQLPKTIPLEQLQCDISQPIEPEFCLTERHDFVPKGLSPTFLNLDPAKISTLSPGEKNRIQLAIESTKDEFLANVKWQDELTGDYLKPVIPDVILFEMRRKSGESAHYYENPVISASLSYCAVKIHNLLHSFAFTKELLSTVEILGQLDKKFIVTKMKISAPKKMELISLFDQHAVDERIKLEELIAENILPDGNFISTCLNPPEHCVLTESDVRAVFDLKEKIFNFGLNAEIVNETTVSVKEIPTFLLNKHEKDLKNKKKTSLSVTLKALIMNIINEIRETRGAVPKIPKIIHDAFCLEACHKAIKFNKALSVESMTEMMNKLQSCKLPFQCAHGRPSVIPIIDLKDFKLTMEENEKSFDLQEIKKFFDMRKNVDDSKTVQVKKS